MHLVGHGRLAWSELRGHLDGLECAWTDLGGFHLGPPPAEPPIGTHLWGWSDARWARARLDGDGAILGTLHDTEVEGGRPVMVIRRTMLGWGEDDRIPGHALRPVRKFVALEVQRRLPFSFVTTG